MIIGDCANRQVQDRQPGKIRILH
ncbi:uncharacterized protein METZ01_LOCUS212663, partial [marine metagenome]